MKRTIEQVRAGGRRASRGWVVLAMAVALGACSDDAVAPLGTVPTGIQMEGDLLHLSSIGEEKGIGFRVVDGSGRTVPGELSWQVADASVATHVGGGRFRSLRNGTTTVTVQVEGYTSIQRTFPLTVEQRAADVLGGGGQLRLQALNQAVSVPSTVVDALGVPMDGIVASWTVEDASVARLSGGQLIAVADGTTRIRTMIQGYEFVLPVSVSSRIEHRFCVRALSGVGGADQCVQGEVFVTLPTAQ